MTHSKSKIHHRQFLPPFLLAIYHPSRFPTPDVLDHRNLLSHTYNLAKFEEAVNAVHERYLDAFDQLHEFLQAEAMK